MLISLPEFIGRLHPLLVHLPIGILLLACFFQWLILHSRYAFLKPAIPAMLFWGMLSAIASCISGYLLASGGDYEGELVQRHQWMGIYTAGLALILWIAHQFFINEWIARWLSVGLIILLFITGHLGGSLTHGEGFLQEGLQAGKKDEPVWKAMPDLQQAQVYASLVQPLLQARCYSCHGPNKQKGKLRLDSPDWLLKGGEDGKAIKPGDAEKSLLIERLMLPMDDKEHMPPREKTQLTADEIAVLHWWVNSGAAFDKRVSELKQPANINQVLQRIATGQQPAGNIAAAPADIPAAAVAPGDTATIRRLRQAGVMILPVAANSNYLSASFFTATAPPDSLLPLLTTLKKQLIWLRLDNTPVSDASLRQIGALTQLTRLQLSNTAVTDAGLPALQPLINLHSLNLVGTKVTATGLYTLASLKQLRYLYLYQTAVAPADWPMLLKQLPGIQLDSGGYRVPTFEADTTELKY